MDESAGHRRSNPHARSAAAIALTTDAEAFAGIAPCDTPRSTGAGAMLTDLQRAPSGRPEAEAVALRDLVSAMEGDSFPVLILLFAPGPRFGPLAPMASNCATGSKCRTAR